MGTETATSPHIMSSTTSSRLHALIATIADQFAVQGEFVGYEEVTGGLINSTFRVSYRLADGSSRRYILQAINGRVFKNPYDVMRNVESVTRHINSRVLRMKQDFGGQTLHLYPARNGASWIEDENSVVWRCYNHIDGCVSHEIIENTRQAYQAARAFGAFQDLVSDLDPASIVATIPDFHHTRNRFVRLLGIASADPHSRLESVREEFDFILARENLTGVLLDLAAAGRIPTRVTHNDTKISNVLMDTESDEAVCVIDLDTVMPGLALYDFGDLVRSATNPAAEDEQDLSKVRMQLPIFEALVQGYLDTAANFLNPVEIGYLHLAGRVLALEVAIRFLTDHLEGDVYFRTHRPNQNLDRCRTQLKLLESMESQEAAMKAFVRKVQQSLPAKCN